MASRLAAVRHRRIERRHLFNRIGQFFGARFVVLVQAAVRLAPRGGVLRAQLVGKVLAQERVAIERVRVMRVGRGDESRRAEILYRVLPIGVGEFLEALCQSL